MKKILDINQTKEDNFLVTNADDGSLFEMHGYENPTLSKDRQECIEQIKSILAADWGVRPNQISSTLHSHSKTIFDCPSPRGSKFKVNMDNGVLKKGEIVEVFHPNSGVHQEAGEFIKPPDDSSIIIIYWKYLDPI